MPNDNPQGSSPLGTGPATPSAAPVVAPVGNQPLFPMPRMDAINAGLETPRGIQLRDRG